MAAFFIAYYVVHYILDLQFINKVCNIYSHLQSVCLRPSYVQYIMLFTMEDILEYASGGAVDSDGNDLRSDYSTLIYNNENTVASSIKASFPSDLNDYTSLF